MTLSHVDRSIRKLVGRVKSAEDWELGTWQTKLDIAAYLADRERDERDEMTEDEHCWREGYVD